MKEINPVVEFKGTIHNNITLIEHVNSVDCICVNPKNANEFATGSHDKTIKLWDVNKDKSVRTLTGHKEGVWCLNYHNSGQQFVTASPEGIAKVWDVKSGKPTHDLKVHTKRVFWATYDNQGTHIATCGSDRLLAYWDTRSLKAPVATNTCTL